jgi:hypothetical protein
MPSTSAGLPIPLRPARWWLSTNNLDLPYPSKFKPADLGPFHIKSLRPHSNAAELELPSYLNNCYPVFNASLLKPFYQQDPALGPQLILNHLLSSQMTLALL